MSDLHELECCTCFMVFAFPQSFHIRRRQDGRLFYCPQGHAQSYTQSENDRLRQERDRLKQREAWYEEQLKAARQRATDERAFREAAERQAAARKGQITRLRNRAAAGVCPCCNRSFENLRRHMATKHPQFHTEAVA